MLPADGPLGAGLTAAQAGTAFLRLWDELPRGARRSVALMLGGLEAAAVLRTGRTWGRLGSARRHELCEHLEQSAGITGRSAFLGVKTLVLVLAAEDPAVRERLGTGGWPPQVQTETP